MVQNVLLIEIYIYKHLLINFFFINLKLNIQFIYNQKLYNNINKTLNFFLHTHIKKVTFEIFNDLLF